jgi:hypothetical protein
MPPSSWTEADSLRAKEIWAEYQRQHDVSALRGQAVGIDPVSERVWFGESAAAIMQQQQAEGIWVPLYFLRVGSNYYQRIRMAISRARGVSQGRAAALLMPCARPWLTPRGRGSPT